MILSYIFVLLFLACSTHGEEERTYKVLVGKTEVNRPLGRARRSCKDNAQMELQEVGLRRMDWIERVADRDRWRALVNAAMNFRVT